MQVYSEPFRMCCPKQSGNAAVHFLRNALDYLPRKADDDCLQELRWIYDQRDFQEARPDWSG